MTMKVTLRNLLLVLAATFAGTPLFADDAAVIPDDELVYCTVCHGVQVGGNDKLRAPRLSGLSAWYVERQLEAFGNGWRGAHDDDVAGLEMRPMAAILSDDGIRRAAAYVDAVDSAPPAVTIDGDAGRGARLYDSCAACHGRDAEGNEALGGPALTGLNDWYQLTQLKNFKAGVRGAHPDDTRGRQMQAAAALLADEQAMKDVIRYIATLNDRRETTP